MTTILLPLHDAFGRELNIGDVVLGAKGRPNHFVATYFMHSIVIGRTKGMLKLHQIDSYNFSTKEIMDSITRRMGRDGGRVNSREVIQVLPQHLTEQQIELAVAAGKLAAKPASFQGLSSGALTGNPLVRAIAPSPFAPSSAGVLP